MATSSSSTSSSSSFAPVSVAPKKKKAFTELNPDEWYRGARLSDVEQRCLKLCSDHIGGSWNLDLDVKNDIKVRRLAGGLTNQLYHVQLQEHVPRMRNEVYGEGEPREVAIKFYQSKHFCMVDGGNERLSDTIITVITSQLGIGPKVYGLSDDAVVQAYYKHEPFKAKHQQNEKLLRELMHRIAQINLLQVPYVKNMNRYRQNLRDWINAAYSELNIREKVREFQLETLTKNDLMEEFVEFERIFDSAPNPLVFCHNDFRSLNLLVTEGEQKLVICDFDACCYGNRGHDLANFVFEWGQGGESNEEWGQWDVPSDQVIAKLAKLYLEGCDLVQPGYSTKPGNSLEELIRDIKLCLLETLMWGMAFMVNVRESFVDLLEFDQKESLKMVETHMILYLKIKQKLLAERLITISS